MASSEAAGAAHAKRWRFRPFKALFILFLALIVLGTMGWSALFLSMSPLPWEWLRNAMAALFVVVTLCAFLFVRKRWRTLLLYAVVFAVLLAWYYAIPPSNDRVWADSVARLASATVEGNLVHVKNIRNFEYRSATEFTPNYYDKTFDLDQLQSTDLILVTWGNPAIAHLIASFGFEGDDYLAFSIEMRIEKGEDNSMVKSFFRQYELIYIVADERDVVRLRTNYRNPREQATIFRTRLPIENQRTLFLSYIEKVNQLATTPEWYNTLEDNCTTGVLHRTKAYQARARYTWKVLLSGFVAEYGYELGMLDTSIPFEELKQRGLINARAALADQSQDFSVRIREGLPMPEPYTMQEFIGERR